MSERLSEIARILVEALEDHWSFDGSNWEPRYNWLTENDVKGWAYRAALAVVVYLDKEARDGN